jgi:hypothetical protein
MGEVQWMSPFHLTYPHGVPTEGVRSNAMLGNVLGKRLDDKKIDKYQRRGVYNDRKYYRAQLRETQQVKRALQSLGNEKRMVYDLNKQDFVEQ